MIIRSEWLQLVVRCPRKVPGAFWACYNWNGFQCLTDAMALGLIEPPTLPISSTSFPMIMTSIAQ